jgi:hypothetical protein
MFDELHVILLMIIFILVGFISYKNSDVNNNKIYNDIESNSNSSSNIFPNNSYSDKPITVYKMEYRSRNASL